MLGRSIAQLGNPSLASETAADDGRRQPFARPLGTYTGAPAPTILTMVPIAPGATSTRIAATTRENRFVTLIAPFVAFTIAIGPPGVTTISGMALTPGIPYEVSLPGNQELHAISNAPIMLQLRVQVAGALAGDLERRL